MEIGVVSSSLVINLEQRIFFFSKNNCNERFFDPLKGWFEFGDAENIFWKIEFHSVCDYLSIDKYFYSWLFIVGLTYDIFLLNSQINHIYLNDLLLNLDRL